MTNEKIEDYKCWSIKMPTMVDAIIEDYRAELEYKKKVNLNKHQVLCKIVLEWKNAKIK